VKPEFTSIFSQSEVSTWEYSSSFASLKYKTVLERVVVFI